MIRDNLFSPYWVTVKDLSAWDFCREIAEPDTNEKFPLGAVGLRVDSDFWLVGVLPYEYKSWDLKDLLKDLWPLEYKFTYRPDSGSLEQTIEFLESRLSYKKKECDHLYSKLRDLERTLRYSTLDDKELL